MRVRKKKKKNIKGEVMKTATTIIGICFAIVLLYRR